MPIYLSKERTLFNFHNDRPGSKENISLVPSVSCTRWKIDTQNQRGTYRNRGRRLNDLRRFGYFFFFLLPLSVGGRSCRKKIKFKKKEVRLGVMTLPWSPEETKKQRKRGDASAEGCIDPPQAFHAQSSMFMSPLG